MPAARQAVAKCSGPSALAEWHSSAFSAASHVRTKPAAVITAQGRYFSMTALKYGNRASGQRLHIVIGDFEIEGLEGQRLTRNAHSADLTGAFNRQLVPEG